MGRREESNELVEQMQVVYSSGRFCSPRNICIYLYSVFHIHLALFSICVCMMMSISASRQHLDWMCKVYLLGTFNTQWILKIIFVFLFGFMYVSYPHYFSKQKLYMFLAGFNFNVHIGDWFCFFILEEYNLWANDLVDYILSCLFVCYFYYINTIGFGGFYLLSFFFLYFFVFILWCPRDVLFVLQLH